MWVTIWQARHFVYDDAYISLRYAQNLVEHGQLVWNVGEFVEGYTNFLFVVLSAGLMALGVPATLSSQLLALSAFACTLGLTGQVLRGLQVGPLGLAIGFAATAGSIALPVWAMSGMETPLVAALIVATLCAVLPLASGSGLSDRRALLAGIFGALAFLTRMDAAVLVALIVTTVALTAPAPGRERLRPFLIVGAVGGLVALLQTIWRWWYYDSLLPNTFYAKVDVPLRFRLDSAASYLLDSMGQLPFLVVSLLVSAAVLAAGSVERTMRAVHLACFAGVVGQMAYVFVVGGDHLPAGRFLAPVLPLAAISLGIGLRSWSMGSKTLVSSATLIAAACAAWIATPRIHGGAEAGLVVGEFVRDEVPVGQTIALNVAGATPFVAKDHRFIDMPGLNDAVIGRRADVPLRTAWQRRPGHAKGDGAYVLSRAPEIIIVAGADGDLIENAYHVGELELADHDEFYACYEPRVAIISAFASDWHLVAGGPAQTRFTYYERVCPSVGPGAPENVPSPGEVD